MTRLYMLDTNIVSYIVKGSSPAARGRLAGLNPFEIACISVITEAEIRFGLARSSVRPALAAAIEDFLFKVKILPWGRPEAHAYGALRAKLEAVGKCPGNLDLMIAAHAIAADAVLITKDAALSRVDDLRGTVNWATDT